MDRKIYISDGRFDLAEYIPETDAEANYACWQDIDTQRGYNYKPDFTLEEFKSSPNRARFRAVAVRKKRRCGRWYGVAVSRGVLA